MTSPARVEGSARVRETMNVEAAAARARAGEGDSSLALTGGRSASSGVVASDVVVQTDASRFGRIASAMALILDPMVMLGMARAAMKDSQVSQQEDAIELQSDRAEQAAQDRMEALDKALKSAEEAKGWGVFAQVALRVAAVAAAVVGFVSGAFTGGAGAVLAVGLLIVAFGNDLALMMDEAGVEKDVTNAIGIGASIVGTCCTLGASAASLAGVGAQATAVAAEQTARQVAERAVQEAIKVALELTKSAADIAGGTAQCVSAGYGWDAAHRHVDAEVATATASDATDLIDQHVEDTREFMASYQRVVERLTRTVEARDEAMRAASQQRA